MPEIPFDDNICLKQNPFKPTQIKESFRPLAERVVSANIFKGFKKAKPTNKFNIRFCNLLRTENGPAADFNAEKDANKIVDLAPIQKLTSK